MELRAYQQECIEAIKKSIASKVKRTLVKAPCSFGKTIVFCEIARLASLRGTKVLVVVDSIALVVQTFEKMKNFLDSSIIGIYCASLNSTDDTKLVTISTIQSIRSTLRDDFRVVIFDETHDGLSRISDFAAKFPNVFAIGFTATPYSPKGAPIYGVGKFYESLCYEMPVQKMLAMGLITPMVYGAERDETKIDFSGVRIAGGDYNQDDLQKVYDMNTQKIEEQIQDMIARTSDRKKVIIMCTGIKHADYVATTLGSAITYHSEISLFDRKKLIKEFEEGSAKYLVGVMAIYKGLDIPVVDCLVNMRPTRSKSFFVQFAGRGVRKHEAKENCVFLDYGQTVENLGFYEDIKERVVNKGGGFIVETYPKKCPKCLALVAPQMRTCACGYKFPYDLTSNTTVIPYGPKSSTFILSPFSKFDVIPTTSIKKTISIAINDPSQIPQGTNGSSYTVNFYYRMDIGWQVTDFKKVERALKASLNKVLHWKVDRKGWPVFISCV